MSIPAQISASAMWTTGTRLVDATDGRTYSDDAQTRAAKMHLLGDRYGYIYAPLLGNFADKMIGYDKINGLYTLREEYSTAQLSISAEVQKAYAAEIKK